MIRFLFFLSFFLTSPLFALEWDEEKYAFPEEDPHWLSQVQPGAKEFNQISMAAKSEVLERVVEEKKQAFLQLVEKAGTYILHQTNNIVGKEYLEEWHQSFTATQQAWLVQLELERMDYWLQEGSLGGTYYHDSLYFKIDLIEQRMASIKNRWWFKEQEKIFVCNRD